MLSSFYLNGHTLGFHLQTQELHQTTGRIGWAYETVKKQIIKIKRTEVVSKEKTCRNCSIHKAVERFQLPVKVDEKTEIRSKLPKNQVTYFFFIYITLTVTLAVTKSTVLLLTRIFRLGEKFRVVEGHNLPKGSGDNSPPHPFHEKCYSGIFT